MKKIIVVFTWLLILAGLGYYLISHAQDLKKLIHISFLNLLIFTLAFFGMQFFNGLRMRLILCKKTVRLGILESFHLTNINTIANYLPFKGGIIAVALYLKKKYALSYMDFAKLIIANQILLFITIITVTILSVLFHYILTGIFLYRVFWLFAIPLIFILLAIFLLNRLARYILPVNGILRRILEGVDTLSIILADKKLALNLVLINCGITLIMGIRFAVSFNILSFRASPLLPFIAGQVNMITALLSIVPSGLGIAEFMAGVVSELMGGGLNIGIYGASVDRIISVLLLLLVGLISFRYIYHGMLSTGKRLE